MRTELPAQLLATERGQRANEILRSCVHCGFCNATCPTYNLLGDELDGPRGRIYLIKELLENDPDASDSAARAQQHLDRCLTCRACETTCPSGVAYGELLEIGRAATAAVRPRSIWQRLLRGWLTSQMSSARRVRRWSALGRAFAFLLPKNLRRNLPPRPRALAVAQSEEGPQEESPISDAALSGLRVLLLDGCVQQAATPATNQALQAILQRRGAKVLRLPKETCCGALALHLDQEQRAIAAAKELLDQYAQIAASVDLVVSSASGCGVTQRGYPRQFADQSGHYRLLARSFSDKLRDASEVLALSNTLQAAEPGKQLSWHAPCTLQHGQRVTGVVESVLTQAGYELLPVRDGHLCCGSAGTYSVLQQELSAQLGEQKVQALMAASPDLIATANVGCQLHLGHEAPVPVRHWLELLR